MWFWLRASPLNSHTCTHACPTIQIMVIPGHCPQLNATGASQHGAVCKNEPFFSGQKAQLPAQPPFIQIPISAAPQHVAVTTEACQTGSRRMFSQRLREVCLSCLAQSQTVQIKIDPQQQHTNKSGMLLHPDCFSCVVSHRGKGTGGAIMLCHDVFGDQKADISSMWFCCFLSRYEQGIMHQGDHRTAWGNVLLN